MWGLRWSDVLVPAAAMSAVLGFVYLEAFAGHGGNSEPDPPVRPSAEAKAEAARLPPCTKDGEPINFAVFTLGRRFAGLDQTDAGHGCSRPELLEKGVTLETAGGPRHVLRSNLAILSYGDCDEDGEPDCRPPLRIETWPACERNAASSDRAIRPRLRIRGAPAAVLEGGHTIELYTGRITVVISGDDPRLVEHAARSGAVVRAGTRFPSAATGGRIAAAASERPLARPARGAMKGRLGCRKVSPSDPRGV